MKTPEYQEALDAFANPLQDFIVEPLNGGLINHSYKVTSKANSGAFLLQQINDSVFTDPEKVQRNYELLWKYLKQEHIPFIIPAPKYFIDKSPFYTDRHHHYWRIFEYMPGTVTKTIAENPDQARAVAETFARFSAAFRNFDSSILHITIPKFHDLSHRYKQFTSALHSGNFERLGTAASLVDELKKRERYVSFYEVLTDSQEFPLRVMHHDAKIGNILFDEENGNVVCPVDFDTTMPGYFFSDLGDMIRTMACTFDENSTAFSELAIRKDYYETIVSGYLSIIEYQLTPAEKKYIHYAGIIMLYMQSLRFISDYLVGDKYYKINNPNQNYDRSKNQFTLLQQLETFLFANYQFKV
jgi:thiamine kinase-like enzyme